MAASPSPFLRCARARALANLLSVGFLGGLFGGHSTFFWFLLSVAHEC